MSGDLDEVLAQAEAWRAAGKDVALATVIRTWGSSPRPAGSQLVAADTGEFRGSVSGGCIEAAVVKEAQGVLRAGTPKLLHYGVTNEMAWEVGLACGGKVDVLVERADPAVLAGLARARADKQPVVLATWLEGGDHALLEGDRLDAPARRALTRDQAEVVDTPRGQAFLLPVNPPLRLVIVGAVHVAAPLVHLAAVAGFDVTVVDPRTAFELPGATRLTDWPDVAIERLRPDRRTAVVTLTHDPKLDDPALTAALKSAAFYIGCLGSGKTHAARLRRLADEGFTPEILSRLHGPVGLRIGARTPAEIAVSILAQIVETLRAEPDGSMIFGRVATGEAVGAVLAHSLRVGERMLKKGHVLTAADVQALAAAGHGDVVCARLEDGDVEENAAAARVAATVVGANVRVAEVTTGRANLHATAAGLAVVDAGAVDRLNAVDESVTVATCTPYLRVEAGAMVATVKIIPFAVAGETLEAVTRVAAAVVDVRPFAAKSAGLILTHFADTPPTLLDRAAASQRERLERLGARLAREVRVAHDEEAVAAAIVAFAEDGLDPILVLGASAIVDRRDVVPSAVERAGGHIDHLGMPVDPGNLLLLGHRGDVAVIGVPGCARSLKPSGFDWVLERLCAGVPATAGDLTRMGTGGLLDEPPSRPQPRAGVARASGRKVAALVLAAGRSSRMGARNKLLQPLDGTALVVRAVEAALASQASPVVVVTGHMGDEVAATLAGRSVTFVSNPDFAEGMSTSLRAGLAALPDDAQATLVCLGDMPRVTATHLDHLIAAFDPTGDATIVVPTYERKRGNPVLFSRRHFAEMMALEGDVGARALLDRHADAVRLVPVDDAGVTIDVDTPEMLESLGDKSG